MNPLQFGYDPNLKGYEYNPEKARALLKEAGYENGLDMDVWEYMGYQHQSNEAAMGYLGQGRHQGQSQGLPGKHRTIDKTAQRGQTDRSRQLYLGFLQYLRCGCHSSKLVYDQRSKCYNPDPEIDAWLTEARFSIDPQKRKELYAKAQKKIIEEAYWMPFFIVHTIWGRHKDLEVIVGRDEVPRFQFATWN